MRQRLPMPSPSAGVLLVAALLSVLALLSAPGAACAQAGGESAASMPTPVKADFKGMVGLGLVGAELGFVVPALAGARDAWAYIVFPILGAGGGAVGGYYLLERSAGEPELAVASLTVGMALIIPTMVITLVATAYDPETDERSSRIPADLRAARDAGPGLVRFTERGVRLAAPGVAAAESVSVGESLRTGVPRDRELSVAVLSGVF